jgi:hypothetical protein
MKDESLGREQDELLARLVRAGAAEKPSLRSMSRTLSALGLSATTLGVAASAGAFGAGGPASALTLAVVAKWASVGLASGVVAASLAHGVARLPSSASSAPGPSVPTPSVQTSVRPHAASTPSGRSAASSILPSASSSAPGTRPPSTRFAAPEDAFRAPLAAELVIVDEGRALLQRNDLGAALSALERYERDFADPRLLPEVLYLRMEALTRLGMTSRAVAVARQLVRDFPRSPHAARARAVLAGGP